MESKELLSIRWNLAVAFDIDAMNGFTPLCPNELPVPDGDKIVDGCLSNHKMAKYKMMSKDAHPYSAIWTATKTNPQFSPVGNPNSDIHWNRHCVVGTYGFELLKGLPHASEYDYILYKGAEFDMHPYSPVYHDLAKKISTGVIEWAKARNIKTFLIGGLALDYCVKEGVVDLLAAGFQVIVNLSAVRGIGDCTNVIKELESLGAIFVESTDEIESIDYDLPF
jgi:nicotinamidase/pyrazinamidase